MTEFQQGAVGAGTGMTCLGYKGGIGSASRVAQALPHDKVLELLDDHHRLVR